MESDWKISKEDTSNWSFLMHLRQKNDENGLFKGI